MKTCLITGGNAGIGREAAVQMAKKGYHVIIGCRNELRGKEALKYIKNKSKSEYVSLVIVDMSLFKSIKLCAKSLKETYDKIDVLIHNAAIFDISQKKANYTEEGFETVWMTNHIGPVYLTKLLLELLKNSTNGRIITISSKGLLAMPRLKIDLEDPEFKNRKFSITKAYYQSKLAQVMYTYWLADKLKNTNITVNSIRVTAVKVDLNRHPNISNFQKFAYKIKSKKSIEPEKMAKVYTYIATEDKLGELTGKYFDENCEVIESNKYSKNIENIERVMELTNKYIVIGEYI